MTVLDLKEKATAKGKNDKPASECPADAPGFDIYIDPGRAGREEIDALLRAFSELDRALGGKGIIFEKVNQKREDV